MVFNISLICVLTGLAQGPFEKGARVPNIIPEARKEAARPDMPVGRIGPAPSTALIPPGPPTSPTLVKLDFKDQPAARIIRALDARVGGGIELFGQQNEPTPNDKLYTLEAPAPVPLWDAIDRLATTVGLNRSIVSNGMLSNARMKVQFQPVYPPTEIDLGPALYVGAFRLGPVAVHERFEQTFLSSRRLAGFVNYRLPAFCAEIPLMAEPGLLYIRTGTLKGLEAIDDRGQSLVDASAAEQEARFNQTQTQIREIRTAVVPLVRPKESSKTIATLRGAIPLEVARRPAKPSTTIKLEGSSGKVIRDGDIELTIVEFKAITPTQIRIKLKFKIDGKRGEANDQASRAIRDLRLWTIASQQVAIVDSSGNPLNIGGGGGPNLQGELNMDYTHTSFPGVQNAPAPTSLVIYRDDWVNWDLKFEFKDLPLP